MADPIHDDAFEKHLVKAGLLSSGELASARAAQGERAKLGIFLSLADILVEKGLLTAEQRVSLEGKIASRKEGVGLLGGFRLLRKIGEGGMGAVYLAEPSAGGPAVALKVLPRTHAKNEAFVKRFHREAEAATKLNHVNIVQASAFGEDKGYHYYVMQYCEGQTLKQTLRESKFFPVERAGGVVMQVARGLKYAHELGFVHRDIKPDNVIVTPEGVVKILDLGLSKNLDDAELSFRTVSGVALGTPHYIAPEQARGERTLDGRADIYSLGATYYHLVTGDTPFHGSTAYEIITKHLTQQIPDPRDIREEIPESVVHVIRRMMAKKPEHRYRDAGELLDDLEHVVEGKPPKSQAIDAELSSIATPLKIRSRRIPTVRGEDAPAPSRPLTAHPAFALLAGFLLVGVLGIAMVSRSSRFREEPAVAVELIRPAPPALIPSPDPPGPRPAVRESRERRPSEPRVSASKPPDPGPSLRPEPLPALPVTPEPFPPPLAPADVGPPASRTIDLLALADVESDAVSGTWTSKAGALESDGSASARIEIPFQPAEEYDLRLEFTVKSGTPDLSVVLAKGERSFQAFLGGYGNSVYGFGLRDGVRGSEDPLTVKAKDLLRPGRRHEVLIRVRRGELDLSLDGRLVAGLKTDARELQVSSQSALRREGILGLVSNKCATSFTGATLEEIRGRGRSVRAAGGGLVGHWPLDGDVLDASGRGRHGSVSGPSSVMEGRLGGALKFDGSGQAEVPDGDDLRITGDLSIAFWVRQDAEAGDWVRLVGKGGFDLRNYGVWMESDGRILFQQYDAGRSVLDVKTERRIGTGAWIHVAAVISGESGVIYLDGETAASGIRQGKPSVSGDPLTFGGESKHRRLRGCLDDVRLYARALDASEIRAIMAGAAVKAPIPAPAGAPAAGLGSILWEIWNDVPGPLLVSDLIRHPRFPERPTRREFLLSFSGPRDIGDNYGVRMRGYVHPPATGPYVFWIASDDGSELWLSPSDDPGQKVKIAFAGEHTAPEQWEKNAGQRSAPQILVAGRRYYIEALQKEGIGNDHLSVGWMLPDGVMERPIPGKRLAPPGAAPTSKAAPPDAAAVREAEKRVKAVVKGATADKAAQAQRLLDLAGSSVEDVAAHFVLLRDARDLAAQAGDAELALKAVDALVGTFGLGAWTERGLLVGKLAQAARTPEAGRNVAEFSLALAEEAAGVEDYEAALAMAGRADSLARGVKDAWLVSRIQSRIRGLQEARREADEIRPQLKAVREADDDPGAFTAAGRFVCLVKEDWPKGLALLAKGSDPSLRAIAEKELARPADAAALSDAWWESSQRLTGPMKARYTVRSVQWAQEAVLGWTGRGEWDRLLARMEAYEKAAGKGALTELFCRFVPGLPADVQAARVLARLAEVNPGFDGNGESRVVDGRVVFFGFSGNLVADLSPLRALRRLEEFRGDSSDGKPVGYTDLSPLRDLPLRSLSIRGFQGRDVQVLAGMRLTAFHCTQSKLQDIGALRGMPIEALSVKESGVTDLSVVRGMPLKLLVTGANVRDLGVVAGTLLEELELNTKGGDLSPLKETPLRILSNYTPAGSRKDIVVLRSIKTLVRINGKPAADFLKSLE